MPMRRAVVAVVSLFAALFVGASPLAASGSTSRSTLQPSSRSAVKADVAFGCATASRVHQVRCFGTARRLADAVGPLLTTSPTGLGPADIQSAYKLGGLHASGATVAIVDAYDDPKAESDLGVYRSHYGLPACTTANGCFKKVNQTGAASPLPAGDYGWAEEISLDLDAVSAACPDCHILLVEATSPTDSDLFTAVDTAARLGAVAISNSYGEAESAGQVANDAHFNHPGVAITVSSGDSGYGVSYPAASQYVTAVGGTTLTKATNARGWTETVWSGSGSGCSAYDPKPSWQHDAGCSRRTVADVAADADPASGLAVYDTYNSCGSSSFCDFLISIGAVQGLDGYAQVGGTSLSSPLIASVYALAGNAASVVDGSYPYAHTGSLFDVTSGSNGSCSGSYLCTGAAGYDGPTGNGTPNGTAAF
jgi:subtilase family serine protease